jgi:hypothetical protein
MLHDDVFLKSGFFKDNKIVGDYAIKKISTTSMTLPDRTEN